MIRIVVFGMPGPQGSKRHVGNGVMIESSKKVKPWRQDVMAAAIGVRTGPPLDGPLIVRMVFTLPKPASAPKRRTTYPMRTPDLSKLARSTEDALTVAGIWKDDARVVEYERLAKVYPESDPESLPSPGVTIEIRSMGEEHVTFDDDEENPSSAIASVVRRACEELAARDGKS